MRALAWLLLVSLGAGGGAAAQTQTPDPAPSSTPVIGTRTEDLRAKGQAQMRTGLYRDALAALLAAYEADKDPELLLAIARCHASLGEWEKASFFADEYLRVPEVQERARAESLLAEAKDEAARDREMERLSRLLAPEGMASSTGGTPVLLAAAGPDAAPNEAPPAAVRPPPSPRPVTPVRPLHRRPWVWAVAGALVLSVGAGAAAASSRSSGERRTVPEGDLGTLDRRRP